MLFNNTKDTKDNDQYVVKVSGSGRMTLRNRRFLHTPHFQQLSPHRYQSVPAEDSVFHQNEIEITPLVRSPITTPASNVVTPLIRSHTFVQPTPLSPITTPSPSLSYPHPGDCLYRMIRIMWGSSYQLPATSSSYQSPTKKDQPETLRRSTHSKQPKQFYDPATGKYVEQNTK